MQAEAGQPAATRWTDLPLLADAGESTTPTLATSDIHLWLIHLQAPCEVIEACATVLSGDETARAERFRFQRLRDRYTITRGAVRQILATYLDVASPALSFGYSSYGKPGLAADANPACLTFNISHSQDLAMLAIAKNRRVGVDLEYRETKPDLEQIAMRHFSREEAAAIAALPPALRMDAFYACWTLKEAYLKATGDGLSTPLDSFEVHFPPVARASVAGVASSPNEHLRWQASCFTIDQYAAALVAEGCQPTIYRAIWNPQKR